MIGLETIEAFSKVIEDLSGMVRQLGPVHLLILLQLALGLWLKRTRWLRNNDLIPAIIIPIGVAFYLAVSDPCRVVNPGFNQTRLALHVLNAAYALLFCLGTWLAHALILKRLEKFLPDWILPKDEPPPPAPPEPPKP